jgi:hypothetical protein
MGTKNSPGKFDCYSVALPDEPIFALLARDINAPLTVERWANLRQMLIDDGFAPASDSEKIDEAREWIKIARQWRMENLNKWKTNVKKTVQETIESDESKSPVPESAIRPSSSVGEEKARQFAEGAAFFVWLKGLRGPISQIWFTGLSNEHERIVAPLQKHALTNDEKILSLSALETKYPFDPKNWRVAE